MRDVELELFKVKLFVTRYILGEIETPQKARAVWRKTLLGTGVRRLDGLAIVKVVHAVNRVDEQRTRLGVVPRRTHDAVPKIGSINLFINATFKGKWERLTVVDVLKEFIGHREGHIKSGQRR